jgi:hypothetical protein
MAEMRKAHKILLGSSAGRQQGMTEREDIKMDLRETGCDCVHRIQLTSLSLVILGMNLRVPYKAGLP